MSDDSNLRPRRRPRRLLEDNSTDSSSEDDVSRINPVGRRRPVLKDSSSSSSDESSDSVINPVKKRRTLVFEESSWETGSASENEMNAMNITNTSKTEAAIDSDSSDGQSDKCPICLISLKAQEIGTPEACDHMFCVECIQEWSKNMNTCPVDRQEYRMILVRQSVSGHIYKQIPVEAPAAAEEEESTIVEDPTFCEICGLSDREDTMLLCDGCDLGYHMECLQPPLENIPAGSWFCSDCPPEDVVNREIELYEVQLLLDDAHEMERPTENRRRAQSRLVPRTRHSERVLRRIAENRSNRRSTTFGHGSTVSSTTLSSTGVRSRRRRQRRVRYRTVYKIDETTGETITVRKRINKRKKKKRRIQILQSSSAVKRRLAVQLGICTPRNREQNLPDVRVPVQVSNLQSQRFQAGIPTLSLFGPREELNFSLSDDEGGGDLGVARRRAPNQQDVAILRRSRVKTVNVPDVIVTSSTDVLGSILRTQEQFHSKRTKFSLEKNGKFTMQAPDIRFDSYNEHIRRRPYSENSRGNDSVPSSSGHGNEYGTSLNSPERNSGTPTSTVETNTSTTFQSGSSQDSNTPQDYTHTNLCTMYDINIEENKENTKKDEASENNTPRSDTPASESEIDIYSDIETVSTSKADENDSKEPSPVPNNQIPNVGSDEESNDSDNDMVIDTEKTNTEPEENVKEETAVTSTVDLTNEITNLLPAVTSTSEIQSQAIQSSDQLFNDRSKIIDDDEDSEDGCPNFSIYSKESINLAKNTDITLPPSDTDEHQDNQVEEVSSSPAVFYNETLDRIQQNNEDEAIADIQENVENNTEETPVDIDEQLDEEKAPKNKITSNSGLYSDSEDETIVKRGVENSFGISDIRNMTEDISEEERSYTPCLDERGSVFREGLEGLDTEMISDEDRDDFDEAQELKTASDGDALEINAKESELDFTRPEDYEEGEIVDKSKKQTVDDSNKGKDDSKKPTKKKDETSNKTDNKENENNNNNSTAISNRESAFKKLSKNNKERNYRDKDRDRSKSRERKSKDNKRDKKREKRKEIERYDVRALIAEKPRRLKDQFGRDIRRTPSRSATRTPSPKRSLSRNHRSVTPRRSTSKQRSASRGRGRKKKGRSSRRQSLSRSRSPSFSRRRSRSKTKKRPRSLSRERRKKSRERNRSKGKSKKRRSRSRHSKSPTPKRTKDWSRRQSREWTPSLSRSHTPEQRHLTPSWTPPRLMENTVNPRNLTVILTNNANKKKKEKKKKQDKRTKESERPKKRRRSDRTPPPSKEVFASGDNILVSVSFNKDNDTRDVSTKKRRNSEDASNKKVRKEKPKKNRKKNKDLVGMKPVAIIDLERSPFKEITPSPKDVIVLSDSDNDENRNMQKTKLGDSSQLVASPERLINTSYSTGPKTPPEPQVKFILQSKQTQMRAISNPLHEPDDIEPEENTEELDDDSSHKGPNTPPEPPNSPPSSPDAYDPFEPTKSRSPTPEPIQATQSISAIDLDDNHDDSIIESRSAIDTEKSTSVMNITPENLKSHTPPLADVQPADSQSSIHATPESSLDKSPDHTSTGPNQSQTITKPVAQTIPFSSVPTSIITSTPVSTGLAPSRINIINTTILTPSNVSSIPQRVVLPNIIKASPVKISPTKAAVKSTPIKPIPMKTSTSSKSARKSNSRIQNGNDSSDQNLNLDSPYSPGSSDYEDLFEPPTEVLSLKQSAKQVTKKSPVKVQNAFDSLFGSSPFQKVKGKDFIKSTNKSGKKGVQSGPVKGTKQVGVKIDEDNLKILDDLPNSAVEMQVKDKFLKKLNRQERVVEEVKLVLKPHYNKKHVNKEEYKDILRRAVPKICHNKSGEINPTKIKNLIEAYVKKIRHSKKVTSSSSGNPQKA